MKIALIKVTFKLMCVIKIKIKIYFPLIIDQNEEVWSDEDTLEDENSEVWVDEDELGMVRPPLLACFI